MNEIKVWVGNLGKYNEGELVGKWVTLPIDEDDLEKVLESIGIDNEEYEETFIADYDLPFDSSEFGEYTSIEELNEIAERYNNLSSDEQEIFNEISTEFQLDEVFNIIESENYVSHPNCDDMTDIAYEYIEETGMLNDVPETVARYFDYEAYGRDIDIEGHFIKSDSNNGYIEIL